MDEREPQLGGQPPQWEDVEPLYRELFRRDSPWAADWQVEEALEARKHWFESIRVGAKERALTEAKALLEETVEQRFGSWLRAKLQARGWNQSDLARAIGSYPSAVSKWVNAHQRPRTDQCARIAEALGVPLDDVLEAAGHRYYGHFDVIDSLLGSDIREEIFNILTDIPEALLVPLVPMLRGLAEREAAETTLARVRESLSHE